MFSVSRDFAQRQYAREGVSVIATICPKALKGRRTDAAPVRIDRNAERALSSEPPLADTADIVGVCVRKKAQYVALTDRFSAS